jgi:hypothetical protein
MVPEAISIATGAEVIEYDAVTNAFVFLFTNTTRINV